jgi:large subunit ribosomal protein L28
MRLHGSATDPYFGPQSRGLDPPIRPEAPTSVILVRLPGRRLGDPTLSELLIRAGLAARRAPVGRSTRGVTVAAVCDICAKKPGFGNNRPWSRKITKRRFNPNIQRVRAVVNGTPKRLNVCTGCLKAGKVSR